MPDITMCQDHDCPSCLGCYRYRAIPTKGRQSYFIGSPLHKGDPHCEFFEGIQKGDRLDGVPNREDKQNEI